MNKLSLQKLREVGQDCFEMPKLRQLIHEFAQAYGCTVREQDLLQNFNRSVEVPSLEGKVSLYRFIGMYLRRTGQAPLMQEGLRELLRGEAFLQDQLQLKAQQPVPETHPPKELKERDLKYYSDVDIVRKDIAEFCSAVGCALDGLTFRRVGNKRILDAYGKPVYGNAYFQGAAQVFYAAGGPYSEAADVLQKYKDWFQAE